MSLCFKSFANLSGIRVGCLGLPVDCHGWEDNSWLLLLLHFVVTGRPLVVNGSHAPGGGLGVKLVDSMVVHRLNHVEV